MRELVLIIPMLHRAHRVAPLIASIEEATECDHSILFVATDGDHDVIAEVEKHRGVRLEVIAANTVGDYAKKINHGYRVSDEPLLFLGACDLHFHPGWFDVAARHILDQRNDRVQVGVVGTQDLANPRVRARRHSTHSLVSRAYVAERGTIDEPGKVLHEGYIHEFVDDEFVATAKKRRAFMFENRSVVEHLHPMVGKAPLDEMYVAQGARMVTDRRTFQKRAHLWR